MFLGHAGSGRIFGLGSATGTSGTVVISVLVQTCGGCFQAHGPRQTKAGIPGLNQRKHSWLRILPRQDSGTKRSRDKALTRFLLHSFVCVLAALRLGSQLHPLVMNPRPHRASLRACSGRRIFDSGWHVQLVSSSAICAAGERVNHIGWRRIDSSFS